MIGLLIWLLASGSAAYVVASGTQRQRFMESLGPSPSVAPPPFTVSVIIPALNEEKYIGRLLGSILNQSMLPVEVIVVDSSDNDLTAEESMEFGASVVRAPSLLGNVAAARNLGTEFATGDIFVFTDADVVLPNDFIESVVRVLTDDSVHAAHPREVVYDSGFWNLLTYAGAGLFRPRSMTTRCAAMWAEDFYAVGGYDESCIPGHGCREDLTIGKRIREEYGDSSVAIMPVHIGTSARRYSQQGLGFSGERWSVPIRSVYEVIK